MAAGPWVDVGLTTFARATATLCDGRLLSKREALELLPELGAPVEVVEDIGRRRYEDHPRRPPRSGRRAGAN